MTKNNTKWHKLDNVAKVFPPTSNKFDPRVFRIICELKEDIDSKILQEALDKTVLEYPVFLSCLKKGVFWYYLEETNIRAKVIEENTPPCTKLDNGLLFRLVYYKNRINLEVNHALTDGTGTLQFIRTLLSFYLSIKHKINFKEVIDNSSLEERETDGFTKYFSNKIKKKLSKDKMAYKLKGPKYPEDRLKIISGVVSTKKILELAKKYNTTITGYQAGLLIKSIGETMSLKDKRKSVTVMVPVNLRKYFPSSTVRNFFATVSITHKFTEGETLEDIIASADKQLKENTTKEAIQDNMNSLAVLENIFIIRLIPLFLKDIALKIATKIITKYNTVILSNVGIIKMPEELEQYIELFEVFSSTASLQCCVCSFNDNLTISFTSHFISPEIQKSFFRELSANGAKVIINTNIVEEDDINAEML